MDDELAWTIEDAHLASTQDWALVYTRDPSILPAYRNGNYTARTKRKVYALRGERCAEKALAIIAAHQLTK